MERKIERKLTKEEIKGPDVFISNMQRFSDWLYANRMAVGVGLSILVAVSVVWAIVGVINTRREEAAQELLFKAEKELRTADESFKKPELPPEDKKNSKDKKTPAKEQKPAATKSGDITADYKTALPALKNVIGQYPSSQAAVVASLDLSNLYYDYKKYDDELTVLQGAVKNADHPVTKALSLINLGLAYEGKGDCNNAITQWQQIQNDPKMAPFQADSLVKTALCFERIGQTDKAAEIYKRFDSADQKLKNVTENIARSLGIDLAMPMEIQPPEKVKKFQDALNKSTEYQDLESLLSDRSSVKAAKKYLKLLKKG